MQSHLNIEVKNSPSEAPNYNKEIDIRRIRDCGFYLPRLKR